MENNREEAPQPDQRPTTHYAVAAPVYAAVAKILLKLPYEDVVDALEGFKQSQGLHVDVGGPKPVGIPPELAGRLAPGEEG